jgi:hypothetical protein
VKEGIFHAGFIEEDFVPNLMASVVEIQAFQELSALLRSESDGKGVFAIGTTLLRAEARPPRGEDWTVPPAWATEFGVGRVLRGELRGTPVCLSPLFLSPDLGQSWRVHFGHASRIVRKLVREPGEDVAKTQRVPLLAQAAGRIHAVLFATGKRVGAESPLLVIESTRSLLAHQIPVESKVIEWLVRSDDRVSQGQVLGWLEVNRRK